MNPADVLTIDKITPAADSYISAPCVVEGRILKKWITPGVQHSEQRTEEEHCAFTASERVIHGSNSHA